jgi:rod shape determining protein RodA
MQKKFTALTWQNLHLDPVLIYTLFVLIGFGLFVLYSASYENVSMLANQSIRFSVGLTIMLFFAQIPPRRYYQWSIYFFVLTIILLLGVFILGHIAKGAQRWINVGFFHIQPAELMKIAVPLTLAKYISERPLPIRWQDIIKCLILLIIPVIFILRQPDLGTAIVISLSGLSVLFLAGLTWRLIGTLAGGLVLSAPILWHFMRSYQKMRVLTFLNPERDPLGNGYHIIQSKIAIGSGGFIGKGWLLGTQSHLHFLPEHATDFIFAVIGEELGLIGCMAFLALYIIIFFRLLYISAQTNTTFAKLFIGGIAITFFISVFVNMGMVLGLLPVVGIPLPLVSYGGTSMITLMISFGMVMSIYTHRNLYQRQ